MLDLHSPAEWLRFIGRNAKRVFILLVGVAFLVAGVAMLALPGPGLVVIIVGLMILASEFAWAERVLDRTAETAATAATKVTDDGRGRFALAATGVAMIVAGIVVAVVSSTWRVVGVSVALAGVAGLVTLLPPVQARIEARAGRST